MQLYSVGDGQKFFEQLWLQMSHIEHETIPKFINTVKSPLTYPSHGHQRDGRTLQLVLSDQLSTKFSKEGCFIQQYFCRLTWESTSQMKIYEISLLTDILFCFKRLVIIDLVFIRYTLLLVILTSNPDEPFYNSRSRTVIWSLLIPELRSPP